jgi:hypothetical protein
LENKTSTASELARYTFVVLLVFSVLHLVAPLGSCQEERALESKVQELYKSLREKNFAAVWQLLSKGNLETEDRYVARLKKSSHGLQLSGVQVRTRKIFRGEKYLYAEVRTGLVFKTDSSAQTYNSEHFTLWVFEDGAWRLDDERDAEQATSTSSLAAWELWREGANVFRDINTDPGELKAENVVIVDDKTGNPYLRIGSEAGIFRKHGIDLVLKYIEPSQLVSLGQVFSEGADGANIHISQIRGVIPSTVKLVSVSGGIYAPIFSSSNRVAKLSDLSGKNIALAGFSELQVESIRLGLPTELGPNFSTVTIVNAKNVRSGELNRIIKQENVEALLFHPAIMDIFRTSGYPNIGNIELPTSGIFMTQEFQNRKSGVAQRFLQAHLESIALFKTNRMSSLSSMIRMAPDSTIRETIQLYEKYSRELPTHIDEFYLKPKNVRLLRTDQIAGSVQLDQIAEPKLMKNLQAVQSIPHMFQ